MIKQLIDSVILIDHLNGLPKANDYIATLDPTETAISVITRSEILVGVEQGDETLVKAFLDQYTLLGIDKDTADQAAALRREHGWKLPDAFQAALCYLHGTKLVTRNKKDFDPKKHDFVEIPYQL